MTDCFALLGQARRPWLDPEVLKQKFLAISAQIHPDRVANTKHSDATTAQQQFTALNTAYHCLRDPKERLRHLLELETGAPLRQLLRLPAELMEQSLQVGVLCREADTFLQEHQRTTSPLLQAQLFGRGQRCLERLQALRHQLNSRAEDLSLELQALDARWTASGTATGSAHPCQCDGGTTGQAGAAGGPERAAVVEPLERLYQLFSFYSRWLAQIEERIVLLSI